MESSMRHESTLPSFCSDMSSQQQLDSGSANPVEGDLHADLQNSHIQAPVNPAQQAVPKQEGDIPLAQALTGRTTVKYYLDALGLASGERAGGKHSFPDPDVHDLYSRVTLFVTTSTLPTELSGLRLAIGQPGFLKDESESFMSRFGYIWGDDGRRSAKNDLNISKPEDKATIDNLLRLLIAKRLYKARVGLNATSRRRNASHSSSTLPKLVNKTSSTTSMIKTGAMTSNSASYMNDGHNSDDSESFGPLKRESSPSLSLGMESMSLEHTCHDTTLGAHANHQVTRKDGALHLLNRKHGKLDMQQGTPLFPTRTPSTYDSLHARLDERSTIHTKEESYKGLQHAIEKGRQVGLGTDTALEDPLINTAPRQEQGVMTYASTQVALDWDLSKDNRPEREWRLQRTAFDELLELLQESPPQTSRSRELESCKCKLYTSETHKRMQAALGSNTLKESYTAMVLWHEIHTRLHDFQTITNYTGKAGADWQAHKQTLREISWKNALLPALAAHRELGLFVKVLDMRGEWVASRPDEFAKRVAFFYATLLQQPMFPTEDLVDGIQEYNVELLKWFEVGE